MFRPRAIRQRLTLWLVLAMPAIIVFGGFGTYQVVRQLLLSEFDYHLLARARAFTSFSEPERTGVNLNFVYAGLPEFEAGTGSEYFQIWLRAGTVLAKSPSLGEASLPRPARGAEPQFWNIQLPSGRLVRAVGFNLLPEPTTKMGQTEALNHSFSLTFARDLTRVQRALKGVLVGVFLAGLALVILTVALVRGAVAAGLRPLDELAGQIKGIGAQTLKQRLRLATAAQELQPIVDEFNQLLERVSEALARERRFTANAAHELLTPIAELRALAEAASTWSDDPEATAGASASTMQIAREMQQTVELLLSIARSESQAQNLRLEEVNLSEMIAQIRERLEPRAAAKQLRASWSLPPGLVIQTDRALCQSIFNNLLANAVEYSPEQGRLECSLRADEAGIAVVIRNSNPGLTAGDLPHLFEPFWRRESAHSDRSHTGLGLALVSAFAGLLGFNLAASLPAPDWFEMKVILPNRPPP